MSLFDDDFAPAITEPNKTTVVKTTKTTVVHFTDPTNERSEFVSDKGEKESYNSMDDFSFDFDIISPQTPPVDPAGYPYPGEPQKTEEKKEVKVSKQHTQSLSISNLLDEQIREDFGFFYSNFDRITIPAFKDNQLNVFTNVTSDIFKFSNLFSMKNVDQYQELYEAKHGKYNLTPLDDSKLYKSNVEFASYVNSIAINTPKDYNHVKELINRRTLLLESIGLTPEAIANTLQNVRELKRIESFDWLISDNIATISQIISTRIR